MHAVRAQPDEMSMADQQPGRRGLLLLRERATQRTALLPRARAHCISVGWSAAQQSGCVSDTTAARARRERRKLDAPARKEHVARTYKASARSRTCLSAIVHTNRHCVRECTPPSLAEPLGKTGCRAPQRVASCGGALSSLQRRLGIGDRVSALSERLGSESGVGFIHHRQRP
jgi:hypothetical protein